MATWFKTTKWSHKNPIEAVEVERFTDSSVWIKGNRQARSAEWDQFWPTWGEAHAFLLRRAEQKLASARTALTMAQGHYGNIKGLREP